MQKILLIIQREYLTRVRQKSFLVLTFLVPVLFVGMMILVSYLAINQNKLGDKKQINVIDESGWFEGKVANSGTLEFSFIKEDYASAKDKILKSDDDYLLYIPNGLTGIQFLGKKKPSLSVTTAVEEKLNNIAQSRRLLEAHVDSSILASIRKPLHVDVKQVTENGDKEAHSIVTFILGILCAMVIYMSLLIYGVQVMRGVIEEKVSRIIEVIISSVKPFQLMIGKIVGVGMVGLTQFLLWIILSFALYGLGATTFLKDKIKAKTEQVSVQTNQNLHESGSSPIEESELSEITRSFGSIQVGYIAGCFLFYFLFGYLLYSAIFAAVGSAVDNETETQQFVLPVTLPLIFTFMLAQSVIIANPDSALSVWLSIIPFTSPIAMMIRIQFGVPVWQLAISMVSMVGAFLLVTWVAGRIYRVGILMYGKKASYKELVKWFMYKE